MLFPKPTTPRDEQYLSWIRSLPCTLCSHPGPSDPHHTATGGMGKTGSDYSAIPFCRVCHSDVHDKYGKKGFCSPELLEQLIERLQEIYNTQVKKGN